MSRCHPIRNLKILFPVFLLFIISLPVMAADDFYLYGNQGPGNTTVADAPVVEGFSYFTAVDYFRAGPNKGKMLAATGTSVYIQEAEGSSNWIKVAEVDFDMEPGFIKISPSGEQVALGQGWFRDLLVFDATILDDGSPEAPVNLAASTDVKKFFENYYDFAWVGETHLVINGGWWIVPGVSSESGVAVLDISDEANYAQPVSGTIPGASSGIAVDEDKNLYFGIGYSLTRTGEIKVFPADSWWTGGGPTGTAFAYEDVGFVIAEEVLSSAYLGFDQEGNLHVGGGQYVNNNEHYTGEELGFAALINHTFMESVRAHLADPEVPFTMLDESRGTQYREFYADPCTNDTATGILTGESGNPAGGSNLTVLWNGTNSTCNPFGNDDLWGSGSLVKLTTYHVANDRDGDGDGYYDVADFSPNTYDAANIDSDGDGFGNIIDADFNNDGVVDLSDLFYFRNNYRSSDALSDMDGNGTVDLGDMFLFRQKYRTSAPYYNE